MSDRPGPLLSVVIPVRNEERYIGATLEWIFRQDFPGPMFEVLLIDGESEDATVARARAAVPARFANFRVFGNPKRRSSAGRNIGFREGRGEYFVVIDGHCRIDDDKLFANIVRLFRETGADCLCRPQLLSPAGLTPFQRTVAYARATPVGHGVESTIYGAPDGFRSPQSSGAMYRREVFRTVGFVDESFDACEDVEFNTRVEKAGLRSYYSRDLLVYYYPRESIGKLFRQMSRYGAGRMALLRKHPDTLRWHLFVPLAFSLGVAATPLFLAAGGLLRSATAAAWLLYLLVLLPYIVRSGSFAVAMRLLPVYFTIHLGLGYGELSALLRRVRRGATPLETPGGGGETRE